VIGGVFILVLLIGGVGWAMVRPGPAQPLAHWQPATDPSSTVGASSTPTPSPDQTSAAPSPSASAKPKTTKKVVPKPTVAPPAAEQKPPVQKRITPPAGCQPTYAGTNAPFPDVKAALTAAAQRQYWVGVTPPQGLTGPLPVITVPLNLMKAIAWQESGWQSTIIACDLGVGTMQVMADTASWMNDRFDESYSINALAGNTSLGAMYIEWLTVYFGLYYFGGNYDLSTVAAVGSQGENLTLLSVVIAAYNTGYGDHDLSGGVSVGQTQLTIPNPSYVNNVTALMNNCPCSKY
jgi:soluble lytic murein transglycosylase-like protein